MADRGAHGLFLPGNRAGLGLNQRGARKTGGVISVTVDTRGIAKQARELGAQLRLVEKGARSANEFLAEQLQQYMRSWLDDSVRGRGESVRTRGRAQADKRSADRLGPALVSRRNRRFTSDGYTVGYLDDIAAVKPYWRGLEEGTRVHVGQFRRGFFAGAAGGEAIKPQAGAGKDLFVNNRGGRGGPGVRIRNPIIGYHYMDRGLRNFIEDDFTRGEALATYRANIAGAGAPGLAEALSASSARAAVGRTGLGQNRSGVSEPT